MKLISLCTALGRCLTPVLGGAGLMLLAACQQDNVVPLPRPTVETYEVGAPVVKTERTFHGRVVPADLTRVSFRIRGKISHLAVQAGQQVIQGQRLAQIEDSIQRQVLADARAEYQLSGRQLERAENLHQRGSLSSAQRDQLQAGYRLAEANLKLAQSSLSYTVVTAPFDGIIADVSKELYEAVAAGEPVVTIYRNDRTDVMVNIPDILPAKIHQARDVASIQARVVFSDSSSTHTMRFMKGSTARNPKTQAFQIWLTMPSPDMPYPPGLPATLTIDLQEAGFSTEAGLLVPLTALQAAGQDGEFRVWRYRDGMVNPVAVQVGRLSQQGALISSGLQAGDRLVISGLSRLSAGQAVATKAQLQER